MLRLLASHRNPESYVAGSTRLNRTLTLDSCGYTVTWLRRHPGIQSAQVDLAGTSTRLEWVADSDFRFFPAMVDDLFGYVLHPVDLATNKAMAAAVRRELRDLVDLAAIHATILPLGAVIWAAVEKSPRLHSGRADRGNPPKFHLPVI